MFATQSMSMLGGLQPPPSPRAMPIQLQAPMSGSQQYALPGSQQYALPGSQQYALPGSQQYALPGSQQYALPGSQQYALPGSQQYALPGSQQYAPAPGGYPLPGAAQPGLSRVQSAPVPGSVQLPVPAPAPGSMQLPMPPSPYSWPASAPGSQQLSVPAPGYSSAAPGAMRAMPVMPQSQAGNTVALVSRTPQWPPAIPGLSGLMVDTNGDGVCNACGWDTTGDGFIDALDMDGDGMIDTSVVIMSPPGMDDAGNEDFADMTEEERSHINSASELYDEIDVDGNGKISKLELLAAIQRGGKVLALVPGFKHSDHMSSAQNFDAADAAFEAISQGKKRIDKQHFIDYYCKTVVAKAGSDKVSWADETSDSDGARKIFGLIDSEHVGTFSKFELVNAVQQHEAVASFVLPGTHFHTVLNDEHIFDAVDGLFGKIAHGHKRVDLEEFEAYFHKVNIAHHITPREVDRSQRRVLVIGPGFGRELNPRQCELVNQSGYQVQWAFDLPNPEQPGFPVMQYVQQVKAKIDQFKPHLLACASKGGHYVMALWQSGLWRGPTLMINANPCLKTLPKKTRIVIAHGSEDDLYPQSRADLENLVATASKNSCFLYWAASSGQVSTGGCTRYGDKHNMDSLLTYDCLPRLMDAALSQTDPETHMIRSWRQRLSKERDEAEQWLGHSPEDLERFWVSDDEGIEGKMLYEVPQGSEEFRRVAAIYYAEPKEPATYKSTNFSWQKAKILKLQRVENRCQLEGSAMPHFAASSHSVEDQGVHFEPGVHTRWVFHGTNAVESIVSDPLTGFQPLACGSRMGTLWGSGTYFARDARYVVESNFGAGADGSHRMLMCLAMTGIPCLGSAEQKGILPFRQKPHHYQSTVDSLSSPEIFIVQHPSAAYPAYVITFAS